VSTPEVFFHLFHDRHKIFQRKEKVFMDECRIRLETIIMNTVRYRRKYKVTQELVGFTANAPGL